jgi:hypothetical protein
MGASTMKITTVGIDLAKTFVVLLNHLVGTREDRVGNLDAERLGGFHVNR